MARKPKLDTVLAEAVDMARLALHEIAEETEIGDYCGAAVEGERLVTHRFISHKDGYRGWTWYVTLARIPRAKAKDATVCELGIIPGENALLAPAWVPWADRLAQEEIDAAKDEAERESADDTSSRDEASQAGAETEATTNDQEHQEHQVVQESPDENSVDADVADESQPARRPVRRRRTAQRTAARRRAAARSRGRRSAD